MPFYQDAYARLRPYVHHLTAASNLPSIRECRILHPASELARRAAGHEGFAGWTFEDVFGDDHRQEYRRLSTEYELHLVEAKLDGGHPRQMNGWESEGSGTEYLVPVVLSIYPGITRNGAINVGGIEAGATGQYSLDNGTTWISFTGSSFVLSGDGPKMVLVRQIDSLGNTSATFMWCGCETSHGSTADCDCWTDKNPGPGARLKR